MTTNNTSTTFFFDAHGGLWATCANDAHGSTAFGPTGSAVPVDPAEMGLSVTEQCPTAAASAREQGRVERIGDWLVLDADADELRAEIARLRVEIDGERLATSIALAALDEACWQADGCLEGHSTGTRIHDPEYFLREAATDAAE